MIASNGTKALCVFFYFEDGEKSLKDWFNAGFFDGIHGSWTNIVFGKLQLVY